MFKMINVTVQNKFTERKLVRSNRCRVPNKDRTYGKFGWKKIIVYVRLFSIRE